MDFCEFKAKSSSRTAGVVSNPGEGEVTEVKGLGSILRPTVPPATPRRKLK